jgi:hypothetical protein
MAPVDARDWDAIKTWADEGAMRLGDAQLAGAPV